VTAVLETTGWCPICAAEATFRANHEWLRDNFLCLGCGSVPRERALMSVLAERFPGWEKLTIHESSPEKRGVSVRLARDCQAYIASHYYPDAPLGSVRDGFRCENLEKLTFSDASIDLHVSQDVMEHVFDPAAAFREIARTLKPGGAHVFTVPLVNKHRPTYVRACIDAAGEVQYNVPPTYHGNPISDQGSLVTRDWGFDITRFIFDSCGLFTDTIWINDLSRGIQAEYIEVLVTWKSR